MDLSGDDMDEGEMDFTDKDERGAASFVAGVVLGAVLGAGIALLFAPEKGLKSRERLGRRMRSLGESAKGGIDEAARQATRDLLRRRRRLRHQLDELARETRKTLASSR